MKYRYAAILIVLGGCSTPNPAPFDVYQSPLLTDNIAPAQPRSDYIAFRKEHAAKEVVVATTRHDDSPWRPKSRRVSQDKAGTKPGLSPLSSKRMAERRPDVQMVTELLSANGIARPAAPTATSIYNKCKTDGTVHFRPQPQPGDVVFFHNTADLNHDGRNNDWYSLVGIVESVDSERTAKVRIGTEAGLKTVNLNGVPSQKQNVGPNSQLRTPTSTDAPYTQYRANELFAGYCNLFGDQANFRTFETWQP